MAKNCPGIEYKLDDNFGFIAGRASMALSRKLHQNFKEVGYDITAEQWSVLIKLWEKDGEYKDLTFNSDGETKILFVPDVEEKQSDLERKILLVKL